MTDAPTLTREPGDRDEGPRPVPCLFQVLRADAPLTPSCRFVLGGDEITIGRAEGSTVRLDDGLASGRHARLVRAAGGFTLEDVGSKNGTFVDGERIKSRSLRDGDVFEVGHGFFLYRAGAMMARDDAPVLDARHAEVRGLGLATLSPELRRGLIALADVATSGESVLLRGETGTGKEIAARAVHRRSGRRGELVDVNCAALPETLVEAELFGHRKGAFSGAGGDRDGLVRAAHRGTLFLDEIGDLPLPAQAALLRVLQERVVRPLGGEVQVPVDFRLIVATHRDLAAMVAAGTFREDLWARISTFVCALPPLRERREDLGILVASLLTARKATGARFDFAAARALLDHGWPRNVRELDAALGAALALSRGETIRLEHLPAELRTEAPVEMNADRLRERLEAHRGNVSALAKELGTTRMQIHRWAKRFSIALGDFR